MANLYLREDLAAASVGGEVVVEGAEAKHMVAVSRTRMGDSITVSNGRGLVVEGVVERAEPSRVAMRVESMREIAPPTPRVVLVQALAKGGRDELAVQTAVELGVDVIVPWQAARSVSRWSGDKQVKGVQRWSSIVREATKQSVRAWVPPVEEPTTTAQLVQRADVGRMLVLEPRANEPLTGIRIDVADTRDIVVVIGPEGGISPDESERLTAAGALSVRLGDSVLRTSSAGPAAIAVVNVLLARW